MSNGTWFLNTEQHTTVPDRERFTRLLELGTVVFRALAAENQTGTARQNVIRRARTAQRATN